MADLQPWNPLAKGIIITAALAIAAAVKRRAAARGTRPPTARDRRGVLIALGVILAGVAGWAFWIMAHSPDFTRAH